MISLVFLPIATEPGTKPVSYTHLDVYKRQVYRHYINNYTHTMDINIATTATQIVVMCFTTEETE